MAKISVVVPVYGVEAYIAKCARSLFESDLEDMEFIFVDDCTQDKSIQVLESVISEYPNRKKQVKIVHHEKNKGLPQARKTGLENSTSEFVAFVDSDDWVHNQMYSKMLRKIGGGEYDMVCCNYQYLSDERIILQSSYPEAKTSEELRYELISCLVSNAVWNKIYRRSILVRDDFYFPTSSMDEDDVIVCQAAYYSTKIGYIHDTLYYHYENPESMTHEFSEEKFDRRVKECIENDTWIVQFLESKPEDWKIAILRTKKRCKSFIAQQAEKSKYAKLAKEVFSDINYEITHSNTNSLKGRIYYWLIFEGYSPIIKLAKWLKKTIERCH